MHIVQLKSKQNFSSGANFTWFSIKHKMQNIYYKCLLWTTWCKRQDFHLENVLSGSVKNEHTQLDTNYFINSAFNIFDMRLQLQMHATFSMKISSNFSFLPFFQFSSYFVFCMKVYSMIELISKLKRKRNEFQRIQDENYIYIVNSSIERLIRISSSFKFYKFIFSFAEEKSMFDKCILVFRSILIGFNSKWC